MKRASSWWDGLFGEETASPAEPEDPKVTAITKRARAHAIDVRELCEKARTKEGEEARRFLVDHNRHFTLLSETLMQELLSLDALEKTEAR